MNMNRRNRSMKLKTKVIISFFITIFVPIILCGITFYLFSEYKVKAIGEQYGIENPTYEMLSNNALMLDILTSREYTELSGKVENHPRELENTSYLEKINAKLLKDSSFLAVRKDDEIFFNGSDRVEDHELLETLPAYGNTGIEENGGIYLHSDQKELVKQLDFTFEDGSDGSVFIVTKVDQIFPQMRKMWEEMFFATVLILVFTSFALSFWIYRGVISPLEQLKKATQNIKEGNLDYELKVREKDEFGQLCLDFEEMRQRLKDNAEEKLQYDRESKELISNISHDLKTPITAIKGYVEAMYDGTIPPELHEKYLKIILFETERLTDLTSDLLTLNEFDTKELLLDKTRFDIQEVIKNTAASFEGVCTPKHISIELLLLPDTVRVYADRRKIQQVLYNLLDNAVKFSENESTITVEVTEKNDKIFISVKDRGIGIPRKELNKIWERFYKSDVSRGKDKKGTGLGLSIVKEVIQAHDEHINVISTEGVGTEFIFSLSKA